MDITAHIRELLFGHDCVIIPEFGGFICNYSPAHIDKASGTFYPPVKKVSFNRNLNHNDGLLIKKISGSSGMNYGDTRDMIVQYVSDLRRKLERGETVAFEHIGTFVNNHEGNVQFEPDESVNYNLDAYGFEPFQCRPIEGYDVRKRITGPATGHQRQMIRRYLWRAAVIVPVAAAIIAVSLNADFLKSKVEASSMNPLVTTELEQNKAAVDNNTLEIKPEAVNAADTASVKTEETPVTTQVISDEVAEPQATPVITAKNSYYIITGSFQSQENAGKQISQLQAEGFNPEVVAAGNGFYRVCAMECPDLSTAVSKKDSILSKFPGAWISRKK